MKSKNMRTNGFRLPKACVKPTSVTHAKDTNLIPEPMLNPKPKITKARPTKARTNITLRTPSIFAAHQVAVRLGLIRAKSTSEWIEDVLTKSVRELSPKLRRELYKLAPELRAEVKEGIAAAVL
jgi:hypothetical protein